jgi:hypothetical protein
LAMRALSRNGDPWGNAVIRPKPSVIGEVESGVRRQAFEFLAENKQIMAERVGFEPTYGTRTMFSRP